MNLKESMKPLISRVVDNSLKILGDINGDFMVGLCIGITVISMVLFRFYGLSYAMSPYGQFHLISVLLFFWSIPLSYYLMRFEKNNGKRVLGSLMFPLIVFSLHDVAWLVETHFVPQVYLGNLTLVASLEEYSYHYSKNLINIIPSLAIVLKLKLFKINPKFILTFLGMVVFHLFNIVFQINLYILNGGALLFMELIDLSPYLFLIKKRE